MNASDIIRLLNTNHYAPADLDEVNNCAGIFRSSVLLTC